MRIFRLTGLVALLVWLTGCSSLMFWKKHSEDETVSPVQVEKDEDQTTSDSENNGAKSSAVDEVELKLAKLWARVDELEEEQYRQKEKIRVLEKGLTLGLVPEELKKGNGPASDFDFPKPEKPIAKGSAKSKKSGLKISLEGKSNKDDLDSDAASNAEKGGAAISQGAANTDVDKLSKEDKEKYQAMLASAQDHYRAGRYGRAIVEYSEIGKKFGDRIEGGLHKYWIARSWLNLKEYTTAREHYEEFLKENPSSPWVPRAKLDLAKIEWRLGMQETAVQHFRDIIQKYPYEDAAEMAKMELEQLDKTL